MDQLKDTLRVFVVPTEILDMEELDIYERMTYMVLRSYANGQDDTAFPSYSTIAKKGAMGRKKAIECVKKLEEIGLIVKEERKKVSKNNGISNTSNLYTIYRPAEVLSDKHHPGVPQTPPLVSDKHHPGVPQTPENNYLKELDLKGIEREKKNKKETIKLSDEIPNQVKEKLENYEKRLQEKGLDIQALIKWLNNNFEETAIRDICLVIEELANWAEEIEKPIGAIRYILANSDMFREAKAKTGYNKSIEDLQKEKVNQKKQEFKPIKNYNWLEQ